MDPGVGHPSHRLHLDLIQRPVLEAGLVQLQREALPRVHLAAVSEAPAANELSEARFPEFSVVHCEVNEVIRMI